MSIRVAPQQLRRYRKVYQVLERLDPATSPWAMVAPHSASPCGNIIVFPGSFNPPTVAHLAMLRQARRFANRQGGHWQLYAALSKQIVDKEAIERLTLLDRVVLLDGILHQQVKHSGILLLNRGLYVEQAEGIRAAFPRVRRLSFLLGFDKIVQILDPRYYTDRDAALRELLHEAHLLVAPRGAEGQAELRELLARPENRPFAHAIHPLPLAAAYREISSTQARQSAESGLSVLPEEARDFITRTRPYMQPTTRSDGTRVDLYAERTRALQQLFSEQYDGKSTG
jgi:nicotinamide-nucleotide adenylyltransferase